MAHNDPVKELLDHLKDELEKNGYGEVVKIVGIRLSNHEGLASFQFEENSYQVLKFYLNQTIEILKSLSSASVRQSINLLNSSLVEGRIDKIQVELFGGGNIDLEKLPNYASLINEMQEILHQLNKYF